MSLESMDILIQRFLFTNWIKVKRVSLTIEYKTLWVWHLLLIHPGRGIPPLLILPGVAPFVFSKMYVYFVEFLLYSTSGWKHRAPLQSEAEPGTNCGLYSYRKGPFAKLMYANKMTQNLATCNLAQVVVSLFCSWLCHQRTRFCATMGVIKILNENFSCC